MENFNFMTEATMKASGKMTKCKATVKCTILTVSLHTKGSGKKDLLMEKDIFLTTLLSSLTIVSTLEILAK
jgi:hypothetical protein